MPRNWLRPFSDLQKPPLLATEEPSSGAPPRIPTTVSYSKMGGSQRSIRCPSMGQTGRRAITNFGAVAPTLGPPLTANTQRRAQLHPASGSIPTPR
jgi:hypothetical protein